MGVELEGNKAVQRLFKELEEAIGTKTRGAYMRRVFNETGKFALKLVKALPYRSERPHYGRRPANPQNFFPYDSGRLRRSMKHRATSSEATLESNVPYAAPIHWGWPARNIPPQPFVYDTMVKNRDKIINKVVSELQRKINELVGESNRRVSGAARR